MLKIATEVLIEVRELEMYAGARSLYRMQVLECEVEERDGGERESDEPGVCGRQPVATSSSFIFLTGL